MDTLKTERETERSTSQDCLPLLKSAHINIYRENSFRITGLPVDATEKEIKKHADKLKMMEELGYAKGAAASAFALDPAPSVDQIRDAMQRIKEPENRLVDEFFWFWPKAPAKGTDDPAIQAILSGDSKTASAVWLEMEADPDHNYIAWHNFAIMYHLMALDWTAYHFSSLVNEEHESLIMGYWKESFVRWEKIATDDRVWDVLKSRVRTLDDARLTTGFIRRLRHTLPEALDKINAEVALHYAEQGRTDWAKIHVDFMNSTHQGIDDVEKTAELVLGPTRNRILQHIKAAREECDKAPETGTILARRLIDQCSPLAHLFELFHGINSHHQTELFDDVASALNTCISQYNRKTGDYSESVELYRKALQFATSEEIRQLIQKNIGISERNLREKLLEPIFVKLKDLRDNKNDAKVQLQKFNKLFIPYLMELIEKEDTPDEMIRSVSDMFATTLGGIAVDAYNNKDYATAAAASRMALKFVKDPEERKKLEEDSKLIESRFGDSMCYYCNKKVALIQCVNELPMYGEVKHGFGHINYRKVSISVPRCASCSEIHSQEWSIGCVLWLVAGAIGFAFLDVLGIFAGLAVGWLINTIAQHILRAKAGLNSSDTYPPIKELLDKGWCHGEKPGKYG